MFSLSAKSHKKSSQTGEMLEMKKTMTRMRADMNGYKKEIVEKEKALTVYQQEGKKIENDHTEILTELKHALGVKVKCIEELQGQMQECREKETTAAELQRTLHQKHEQRQEECDRSVLYALRT